MRRFHGRDFSLDSPADSGLVAKMFGTANMAILFGVMLMQVTSAGAMECGIASSIARALGAGRRQDANALVLHAMLIALGFGLAFSLALLLGGRSLYAQMGGSGVSLEAALSCSYWVFGGAVLVWLFNSLAAVIRGTGNMQVPANVTVAGVVMVIPLSPLLIFGWGPVPALGIACRLAMQRRSRVVSGRRQLPVTAPLRGWSTCWCRWCFGLGAPLVAMVGICMGAGQHGRALRATWIGAAMAFALTEAIGLAAAVFPHAWLSLFGADSSILQAGTLYLHTVGPLYGFFGGGLAQVFMAQAAALAVYGIVIAAAIAGGAWFGRVGWPCRTSILLKRIRPAQVLKPS